MASRSSDALGLRDGRLAPCGGRPNCVCSDDPRPAHRVEALELAVEPERAWRALVDEVKSWPRTRIVTSDDSYLHAEVRSRLFGFTDDLEAHLRLADQQIAVRSASRTGYSDLGVNRRRVRALGAKLRRRGVVR